MITAEALHKQVALLLEQPQSLRAISETLSERYTFNLGDLEKVLQRDCIVRFKQPEGYAHEPHMHEPIRGQF